MDSELHQTPSGYWTVTELPPPSEGAPEPLRELCTNETQERQHSSGLRCSGNSGSETKSRGQRAGGEADQDGEAAGALSSEEEEVVGLGSPESKVLEAVMDSAIEAAMLQGKDAPMLEAMSSLAIQTPTPVCPHSIETITSGAVGSPESLVVDAVMEDAIERAIVEQESINIQQQGASFETNATEGMPAPGHSRTHAN